MSVASITKGLQKMVTKLQDLAQENLAGVDRNLTEISRLENSNNALRKEALHASTVADNLRNILGETE